MGYLEVIVFLSSLTAIIIITVGLLRQPGLPPAVEEDLTFFHYVWTQLSDEQPMTAWRLVIEYQDVTGRIPPARFLDPREDDQC